jgi:hypothetical protein
MVNLSMDISLESTLEKTNLDGTATTDLNFEGFRLRDCPIGGKIIHAVPYTGKYILTRYSESDWVTDDEKIITTEQLMNAYDDFWYPVDGNWGV